MSCRTNWPSQGTSTILSTTARRVLQTLPATCKWSRTHKVAQIFPKALSVSWLTVAFNPRRWQPFHFKLKVVSMVENQQIRPGTSYLRFSWPTSKSGSLCSSNIYSQRRSPTSPSTGRPLTTRWRTNILIFSFTYFTWKVQRRHWRGTTTRRSWSCSVIIDFMGHSWSPWIKTKPPMNWSVSRWPTYSLSRRWIAIFKTRA